MITRPWEQSGKPRMSLDGTTKPGVLLDYALRYAAKGWHVFPVHSAVNGRCTCGNDECKSPAKHPVFDLAPHGLKDATTDEKKIRKWIGADPDRALNIAVVTGAISGIVVIDLDIKPGVDGIEQWDTYCDKHGHQKPETATSLTGRGGQHLVFRHPGGHIKSGSNVLGHGIDVRADGGYIVVEPSQHINGQAYAWEGSSDPMEGFPVMKMPGWLITALTRTEKTTGKDFPGTAPGRSLDEKQVLEITSALKYIDADDYHTWIEIGMSLHAATGGGQQGLGLWDEWSAKSDKYVAKETPKKWRSFSTKGFDGVGLATIFARAQANGWVNPASNQARSWDKQEQEFRSAFAAAEKQSKVHIIPGHEKPSSPFPVPRLDELAGWIDNHAMMSVPTASRQGVLALVAAITARRFVSSAHDPCHVFLGVVTESVGEARYVSQALERIFASVDRRRAVRSNRFNSPQSFYRALLQSPGLLYLCSDYGPQIAFARRQPSGLLEQAMHLLSTAWSGQDLQIDPHDDLGAALAKSLQLGDAIAVIHQPALTMLSLVSDDHLGALFRGSEMGRGAVEQILFAMAGQGDMTLREPGSPAVPPWLIDHLQTMLAAGGGNLSSFSQSEATLPPSQKTVEFRFSTRDQAEALRDLVKSERRLWPLAIGAHATLRRLATALSAWADPQTPTVTRPILDWCADYVMGHLQHTIEHYRILGTDDGQVSMYDKTLEVIAKAGSEGVSQREIIHRCWQFRKAPMEGRAKLVESLLADDQVFEIKRGKKSVLVLRKYIHIEGEDHE